MDKFHDYFGATEYVKDSDYVLGGGLNLPIPRHTFKEYKIQYNQKEVGDYSCTVHGAMGAVSDLTGHVFTLDERKHIWDEAIKLGANPNKGWNISDAVDLVRRYYSKTYEPIKSFFAIVGSDDFNDAISKGYTVTLGYRGNAYYNKDIQEDGDLDLTKLVGESTFGHCIRTSDGDVTVDVNIDNYQDGKNKTNTYKVPKANYPILVKNKVYFAGGYVFCYTKDFDEINEQAKIPLWGQATWAKCKKFGYKTENWDDVFAGSDQEEVMIQSGLLTTKLGSVTRGRFLVALDRANLLKPKQ